jgi:transcriptional regulator with XRE-family HTH domain
MIDWIEFGRMLRRTRGQRKLGLREIARDLGVSPTTILRADRGESVSAEIFMMIAVYVLDIDPRVLLK